jgi:hypothetical protein
MNGETVKTIDVKLSYSTTKANFFDKINDATWGDMVEAEWLLSPPLVRKGLVSTPRAGKLDQGYHPSEVGEMSSNYYYAGDCC